MRRGRREQAQRLDERNARREHAREVAAETRHGSRWEVECSSLRDWEQTFENPKRSHVYVMLARCYSQTMLYRWEPAERLLKMSH